MKPSPHSHDPIGSGLRRARPETPLPAGLHEAIMEAVQAARSTPHSTTSPPPWRFSIVTATALLAIAFGWWMSVSSPPGMNHFAIAGRALESSPRLPEQAAAAALSPLAQELEFLDQDLRRAASFVAASVP